MVRLAVLPLAADILFSCFMDSNIAIFCHHHARHCLIVVIVQPFKEDVRHYSTINASLLLFTAIGMVNILAIHMSRMRNPQLYPICLTTVLVVGVILLLYIPALVVHYIGMRRCWNFILVPIRRLQAWRHGYNML